MWCEIRVRGHLDGTWSTWFDGLTVANGEGGESVLAGHLQDQAALHGVLLKARDLGLPLVALRCLGHEMDDALSVVTTDDLDWPALRQPIRMGLHDESADDEQGDEDD